MVLWARRMTERKQNRFVAVVALARKIAGVMYALVRDKAKYQAHRASTARADDTPTVVAAGAAVTALAPIVVGHRSCRGWAGHPAAQAGEDTRLRAYAHGGLGGVGDGWGGAADADASGARRLAASTTHGDRRPATGEAWAWPGAT